MTKQNKSGNSLILRDFSELRKQWQREGQEVYQNVNDRVMSLAECLPVLKDRVVLEIGSNSSLHTVLAAQHAKQVIAVEPDADFYMQAVEFTQACGVDNVVLFHGSLQEFFDKNLHEKYGVDSVLAVRVLYHLPAQSTKFLKDSVLPKCKSAFLVSRENKKHKPQNIFNLHKAKHIRKYLMSAGFEMHNIHCRADIPNDVKVIAKK